MPLTLVVSTDIICVKLHGEYFRNDQCKYHCLRSTNAALACPASLFPYSLNDNKCWRGCWRVGNALALLVGIRIDIATMEDGMEIP